jgi:PKHD-type hydroxylase
MQIIQKRNPFLFLKDGVFTAAECEKIIEYGEEQHQTVIEQGEGRSANLKNLKVSWIKHEPGTGWIFKRLGFLLDGWPISRLENLQFSTYGPGGKCDWHIDHHETTNNGAAMDRLCNAIVQLSPPGNYTGGKLELRIQKTIFTGPTAQGSVLVLDKAIWHRVAPLESGERKSLVAWGLK